MSLSEIIKVIIPKPNSEDPRASYKEFNKELKKALEKERSQSKKKVKSRRK